MLNPQTGNDGFSFAVLPNGWKVGRFEAFRTIPGVDHLVTTRGALDVQLAKEDRNRAALQVAAAMNFQSVAFCNQVHGPKVLAVDRGGPAGDADAMVTDAHSLGLMCFGADCPLILVTDSTGDAVGIAHASWRGTAAGIAASLVETMTGQFGARAADLVACICPSAGPCCYEVGADVLEAFRLSMGGAAERFFHIRRGKTYLDLWAANTHQLVSSGVHARNVFLSGLCTICRNDVFPSYRVEGADAGRFVAVIGKVEAAKADF